MVGFAFATIGLLMVAACALLPSSKGFSVLILSLFLVPGPFTFPNPITTQSTLHRLCLIGILVRLIFEYRAREHDRRIFRMTPVHIAFIVFLIVNLLCGVLADSAGASVYLQLSEMTNLIFLAVLFVTALAVFRSNRAYDVLRPLALGLAISTAIALIEKVTKASYARQVFSAFPSQVSTSGAPSKTLELRGGTVRVRAASEFALQFAWVSIAILPVLFMERLERAKRLATDVLPIVALVVLAVYWSQTRSVASGIGVALIALWILCRDREMSAYVTISIFAAGVAVLAIPSLIDHFSSQVNEGSILIRSVRLKQLLELAAQHPIVGFGFHGGDAYVLGTTDADLAHVYLETGLAGVTVFIALIAAGLLAAVRVFRIEDLRDRRRGAALAAGALVLAASSTSLDSFELIQTSWLFWICVAGALAVSERYLGLIEMPRLIGYWRFALPVVGLALGSLVYLADTPHASIRQSVFLLGVENENYPDPVIAGRWMLDTVCEIATHTEGPPGTHLECRDPHKTSAVGEIIITAKSSAAADVLSSRVAARVKGISRYPSVRFLATDVHESARDSYAKAGPVVGGLTGLLLALLWPAGGPIQRRRRRASLHRRSRRFAKRSETPPQAQPAT